MSLLRRHPVEVVGVAIFAALSMFLTVLIGNTLAQSSSAKTHEYTAILTDASGVSPGDDVRIAGVRVGRVDGRRLKGNHAYVTFKVAADQRLEGRTRVRVSYLNMLGQRYLALENGPGSSARLADHAVIGIDHTSPALDLTELFNAFKPLFDALDPKDINTLGEDIIAVTQGEGATVQHLMTQTAAISQHLAGKDQVISQVIDNLTTVMSSMSEHRGDMTAIVSSLHQLVGALAKDSGRIGTAIDSLDGLTTATDGLLKQASDPATKDIRKIRTFGDTVVAQDGGLNKALTDLPTLLKTYMRAMSYGSWLNIYICNLTAELPGGALVPLKAGLNSEVCR